MRVRMRLTCARATVGVKDDPFSWYAGVKDNPPPLRILGPPLAPHLGLNRAKRPLLRSVEGPPLQG